MRRAAWRAIQALLLTGVLMLSGCVTSGNQFNDAALEHFIAGQTTLPQAINLLQAEPVDVYRSTDGSSMARWAYMTSFYSDGIYLNRELWISFGRDGTFERIVRTRNIPRYYEFGSPGSIP